MGSPATDNVFGFAGFRLDRHGVFRRDERGVFVPMAIGSRALDVLGVLVGRAGDLVSRDEIIAAVWPSTVVEDNNLNVQIAALRRILDDGRAESSCIQTVPGRGYRFAVPVTLVAADTAALPPSGVPPLPDKPSIAVLPFANMSGDPEQEFFADGIAEDIITALSRYPSLFVIARNSSFTYKGRAVDVKQVGRELGVRYVLEGGMRKAGNRIRVTAQLVEAETGKHVWAERYDRDLADIFALQDEITEAVTIAIAPAIANAEQHRAMRKPPGSLDAWAAYQRGLWHLEKNTEDDNTLAERFFQQAVELDPNFPGGHTGLAYAQHGAASRRGLPDTESVESARRAVRLDANDAEARVCLGFMLLWQGDLEGALAESKTALALSPNLASAHGLMGSVLNWSGQWATARIALERSIRLDPRNPNLATRYNAVTVGYYLSGEYGAAIEAAHRTIRAYPNREYDYRWLAAALGQVGRIEEAKEALEKAVAIAPAAFDRFVRTRVPWHRPEHYAHMLDGLRKAGWGS